MATTIDKHGPYNQLPPETRRQGRGGHAFSEAGNFMGHVTAVEWQVAAESVDVLIPGGWRNATILGAESRTGTIRYQDVDDSFRILVYNFFEARRRGDFSTPSPTTNVHTTLVGNPHFNSSWALQGVRVSQYEGGYSNADQVIERELPMNFDDDFPLEAWYYGGDGATQYAGLSSVPNF